MFSLIQIETEITRQNNLTLDVGRPGPQYVTSSFSLQFLADSTLNHVKVLTLKVKGNLEKGAWAQGGAHRVHFEHSLLHDSLTTIRVAPG